MLLLLFSLVFTFANVKGQDRGFSSFSRNNFGSLQAPPFQGQRFVQNSASFRNSPLFPQQQNTFHQVHAPPFQSQRIVPNSGNQKNSPKFHQQQNVFHQDPRSFQGPPFASTSGNIVQQSVALAESAKTLFRSLKNSTLVQELYYVFELSDCLENLEDAIELMDASNTLITKNAPEIIYLEAIVDNLMDEKNVTKLIRSSAKMLRILEDLMPKLIAGSSKICISSLTDSVEDFRSLAHLLRNVLNHRDIDLPEEKRQIIAVSSKIMTDVAKFLVKFNKSLDKFNNICNRVRNKGVAIFNTIDDIMESLSALFVVLGLEEKSKDIMKQGDFLKDIVNAFLDIDELDSVLECGANGAYENLALTLDDLAEIVHSVGIEALSTELGIDLDFIDEI